MECGKLPIISTMNKKIINKAIHNKVFDVDPELVELSIIYDIKSNDTYGFDIKIDILQEMDQFNI